MPSSAQSIGPLGGVRPSFRTGRTNYLPDAGASSSCAKPLNMSLFGPEAVRQCRIILAPSSRVTYIVCSLNWTTTAHARGGWWWWTADEKKTDDYTSPLLVPQPSVSVDDRFSWAWLVATGAWDDIAPPSPLPTRSSVGEKGTKWSRPQC